ncbi:hypothetical protein [Neobacillus niacini]|uniref:hypothetical protein n=1 Tax=Neobacillus niacini TaxID=86668 RepID=UPI0028616E22|nr:hypothetical protein [Neobacillus niacini]MDR7001409.1 hypothetical protein [Neobacillus niacini]
MAMGSKDEYQSKLVFIDLNVFVTSNQILRQINGKLISPYVQQNGKVLFETW